ncbi:hypothetical protein BU17DRAFT_77919 [Hysterangium stoloniferum]|nr:hypothetical protein BU17DRAFT_77919 [Hysterangium stoloniferum]
MSQSVNSSRPSSSATNPPAALRPALKSAPPTTTDFAASTNDGEVSPVLDTDASSYFPRTMTGTSTANGHRYTSKVGFDTFQNPSDTTLFSYTLQVKSEGYKRTRSTRSYLCASSRDESGSNALDWVMESLIQDGDELIIFRGFDAEEMEKGNYEQRREEARELMKWVGEKNDELESGRKISFIVEFVGGKVTSSIERLIALYRPDSLVVGTKERSVLQQWGAAFGAPGMGSVSRYCVSRSPVPVIVVRPERKVLKGMQKRRADPKRGTHFEG